MRPWSSRERAFPCAAALVAAGALGMTAREGAAAALALEAGGLA